MDSFIQSYLSRPFYYNPLALNSCISNQSAGVLGRKLKEHRSVANKLSIIKDIVTTVS
jgi:hypothetical protein